MPGHAAGVVALLGEGRGVQDEDAVGVGQLLGDVAAQLVADGGVVPAAGADEQLQGAALLAGLAGDGLRGLALEPGELAAQDGEGVVALLGAVEQGQVALGEGGQAVGAGADGGGRQVGTGEECLGVGVVEDTHGGLQEDTAVQSSRGAGYWLESCRTVELMMKRRRRWSISWPRPLTSGRVLAAASATRARRKGTLACGS